MKGRKIRAKGLGSESTHGALRATSSKVRQAVFNILGPEVRDSIFVDLYSGTGAMGMEAMSRGAARVYFVESDRKRANNIEDSLEGCNCHSRAFIKKVKAESFIMEARMDEQVLDLIFLDPPYHCDELASIIPIIGDSGTLGEYSLVLAEHEKQTQMPESSGVLVKHKTYKYGTIYLTLYKVEK